MRSPLMLLAATILAVSPHMPLEAQQSNVTAFLTVRGKDTIGVEQYERVGNTVTGTVVSHQGGIVVHDFVLTLGADGLPVRFEMSLSFPDATGNIAPTDIRYALEFGADSATLLTGRKNPETQHVAIKGGAYPAFGNMLGYDLGLQRLRAAHADSGAIVFTTLGGNAASPARSTSAKFVGTDSALVGTAHVKVDKDGRLLGWRLAGGGEGRRVAPFDLQKILAGFAAARAAPPGESFR
jgi:hypothetical protein